MKIILVAGGSVIVAIVLFGVFNEEKETKFGLPMEAFYCEQDSDCVMAINIHLCYGGCEFGTPMSKKFVETNDSYMVYDKNADYSVYPKYEDCSKVIRGCLTLEIEGFPNEEAKCINNWCGGPPISTKTSGSNQAVRLYENEQ